MKDDNINVSSGRILIVDDQLHNLRILSSLLQKKGFIIEQLQNGALVMPLVKKIPPDLILLDVMMPKVNGFDVCMQLKSDPSTQEIPVIFISALNNTSNVIKAFSVGGVDFINKPFQENEVIARVQIHLALRRSQQELKIKNEKLLQEIAERERVEKELLESKKNFEDIFKSSTDILIIVDFRANIVDANPKALEVYGYSKDEFLQLTVYQLIHPDSQQNFKQFTSDIHAKGFTCLEAKDIRKDGTTFIAEVQGSIVSYNGKPHYLGILRDITSRKQAEEMLINAKKASDSANKAKSNFLAMMSHEIRTPMNAIIGMAELTLQSDLNAEQEKNLRVIKESSYHLLNVINEILDFSKIEANKLTIEHIDFDLFYLLDSVIYLFVSQTKEKGLFLNLDRSQILPQYVKGDPIRLKQILVNLINNAIKFTKSGGITVEASLENPSRLVFSVTDTGIGISKDKHEVIFKRFDQADTSITRKHGGTGLGLAICQKLVAMMGGEITVLSEPNSGSTFLFNIQFTPGDKDKISPQNQPSDWAQLKSDSHPLRILLVEDNSVNARIATRFLEKMGHTSVTALNGKEALNILSKESFDIVVMDVEMPEMNGLEATERIRKGEAGEKKSQIPVIAMTAHALNEFRQECLNSGMNDFVSKPVNFYELGIVLKKYSRSSSDATTDFSTADNMESKQKDYSNQVLNKREALVRLDGCEDIFEMICSSFMIDIVPPLDNIKKALSTNNLNDIRFNAHTLKGLCGNISANSSKEIALQIENMANMKDPNIDQLRILYENLLTELEKVKKKIC